MFANLTYQDKAAFFSLLDEYFESRPHLLGTAHTAESPSPVQQLQTIGRFLSPQPSSPTHGNNGGPPTPPIVKTDAELQREAREREKEAQRMDTVSRLAQKSIKHSTAGARSSLGMISRNDKAMSALDKYGAGGLVRGAEGLVGKKKETTTTTAEEGAGANGKGPAPVPPGKKGGVSGLVSGKSFGHVDTSSKMSAFTSMWKDPQKSQTSVTTTPTPAATTSPRTNLPPPPRRGTGSSSASPAPVVAEPEPEPISAEGQAQAIYDYAGSDTSDLTVQSGQIVNVLEKTSDDWWMCEDGNGTRGLVPATYLKEI